MKKLRILSAIMIFALSINVVYAVPDKPSNGNVNISYKGSTTISSSTTENDTTYTSSTGGENALLVSGGVSTVGNITVTKSGDESEESSDFYGTNAAILVYNDATLNINEASITTNGSHANGIFAYKTGTINVTNASVETTGNNSGGIMVTGGGTLNARDLSVITSGNSSAAIRSDRGGGTIIVDGGVYTTNGVGSPAIYSTADITVSDAKLTSTKSEGIVVEGKNSVTLNNVILTDTNTTLNGNSETYKNIFLYQSMSGDADAGTSLFTATDSTITTNKGDTFYVTNTTCDINLTRNEFINNDGDFLRIEGAKWGNSGSNGGNVKLTLNNQIIEGNIVVDNISTLDIIMNDSIYYGSIDSSDIAKNISLTLDENSIIVLTSDTYVDTLNNSNSENANIYLNGHSLYVNNNKVSANENEAPNISNTNEEIDSTTDTTQYDATNSNNVILLGSLLLLFIIIIVLIIIIIKRRSKNK